MTRIPEGSIALEGPARTGKTHLLAQRFLELLKTEPTSSILVLCSNYYRKSRFMKLTQENLSGCYPEFQVTTYSALVRNTLSLFWPYLEDLILNRSRLGGDAVIFPELAGFETSEYMVRKIVAQVKSSNPQAFLKFQGSERSLIMQLIRRIRLRAENQLDRVQMRCRSEHIGEPCIDEVEEALNMFDIWSSRLRVFDNSRQIEAFNTLLTHNPAVQEYFKGSIRHLIADDIDETIPAEQNFIQFLAPTLTTLTIAADIQGGTRRGYLNAYPYDWENLKTLKPGMKTISLSRNDSFYAISEKLLKNWIKKSPDEQALALPVKEEIVWRSFPMTRMEMINQAATDIIDLLKSDKSRKRALNPGDIVVIMPRVDNIARLKIKKQLKSRGIPLQILTGTQRPTDNPICKSLLLLIQLANRSVWQIPLSPVEFRGLLYHTFRLNQLDPAGFEQLISDYRTLLEEQSVGSYTVSLPEAEYLNYEAGERYKNLIKWLENSKYMPLEEQIYSAFSNLLSSHLSPDDELSDIHQLIRSMSVQRVAKAVIEEGDNDTLSGREWFIHAKTGIVADTPDKPKEIDLGAVVLGTPQKVIDFEIERPVHLWLDISSREWSRTDNAPLYNSWVHSVNWDGDTKEVSDNFNQLLTRTRAGHITRTLLLYAGKKVYLYGSELDDHDNFQSGTFQKMLILPCKQSETALERASLREDQVKILSYKSGPMAITAVPGAGKTFISVELILELIERGVSPENILVITYMDSAARTILSRLRIRLGSDYISLPSVSTIHSLARRIITEEDHAIYLGLDSSDIEVIDELQELDTLQNLLSIMDEDGRFFGNRDYVSKGIRYAKIKELTPDYLKLLSLQKGILGGSIVKFISVYEAYQNLLRQQGKLDFTDLILRAIELLKTKPEVRNKYQNRFQYIIEDEAQDSSSLLQSFLELLTGEKDNLIRTGDPNQSIMGFSTADPSVFRDFITLCRSKGRVIEMNQSSRCSLPIIELANRFTEWANKDEVLKNAFEPALITPVFGKNLDPTEKPCCEEFETEAEEREWIADRISLIQTVYPQKSVAILVRENSDVLEITKILQNRGLKAISLTDREDINPLFLFIVKILRLLENPHKVDLMADLLYQMQDIGILYHTTGSLDISIYQNLFRMSPNQIKDASMLQLYYDLHDLARYTFGNDICKLVVRITDLFFTTPQQRSIGYLTAIKAQELVDKLTQTGMINLSPLELVNQEFSHYIERRKSPFRLVKDFDYSSQPLQNRFVQVMTLHKAKGQEFDFVFIPGITESAFQSESKNVSFRKNEKLILDIDKLISGSDEEIAESENIKKLKKVEEEARLIYVGLTRAREGLYLSSPLEVIDWQGKPRSAKPSRYFIVLKDILESLEDKNREALANV